jgi:hypothetical protein
MKKDNRVLLYCPKSVTTTSALEETEEPLDGTYSSHGSR